jgi:hypothetical protein
MVRHDLEHKSSLLIKTESRHCLQNLRSQITVAAVEDQVVSPRKVGRVGLPSNVHAKL